MLTRKKGSSINSGTGIEYRNLNESKTDEPNDDVSSEDYKDPHRWCCFHFRMALTGELDRFSINLLCLIFFIDLLAALSLFITSNDGWFINDKSLSWNDLLNDLRSFRDGTSDLILGVLLKFIILPIFSCFAIRMGVAKELWARRDRRAWFCCLPFCCWKRRSPAIEPKSRYNVLYFY